ncbi:MAG: hypothetical protein HQL76_06040 [Magnetococcales bacterium]|nr:hypothetical protein [Magnetococcales bacterium]
MWTLRTRRGLFWIRRSSKTGKYELSIDREKLDTYDSPEQAAEAVYRHTSSFGWWDWSRLEAPESLAEWKKWKT